MAATAEPKGLKRICMGCGTRFYDFNKRPVLCPSCGAEFTGEVKTKGRRRAVANDETPAPAEAAGEETEEAADDTVVSLEDVEEEEDDDDEDE
ncbi:MAG: TIGR02300 family protein, partial [Proteobacteria bacterium]|nr:TIGR02300 family protein [Pseudomonadota bacterium]